MLLDRYIMEKKLIISGAEGGSVFGYSFSNLSRMYYWSDAAKAMLIADCTILVFLSSALITGLLLAFEVESLSLSYQNLPWMVGISLVSATVFFLIRCFAYLYRERVVLPRAMLVANMAALAISLPFYFSVIGIFDGFCWYVLFVYAAVGFVVLEPIYIIRTQLATLLVLISITYLDSFLPYDVRAYMFLKNGYVSAMSGSDLAFAWSVMVVTSLLGMFVLGYLTGAWQNREQDLRSISYIDELTSVMNRRSIMESLNLQYELASDELKPLSVAMIDLDYFKKINDEHGHPFGDQALKFVARELQAICRKYDLIGRYGGEEFLIVFPECDGANAINILNRLRESLANQPLLSENDKNVTLKLSAGVAQLNGRSKRNNKPSTDTKKGVAELIEQADKALYEAKAQGRDRVLLFRSQS